MKLLVLIVSLFFSLSLASDSNLVEATGGTITRDLVNQYYTALTGDLIPHNSSGTAAAEAGNLGSSSYQWLLARIASGAWEAGDLKPHHTYNGVADCGEGWMLADGRVVNESNYDTEHGSGHWDIYVISSPLDGKYLPDMDARYLVGSSTTTQTGATALTSVGLTGSVLPGHTHTANAHNHKWWKGVTNAVDKWYNSSGAEVDVSAGGGDGYGWGQNISTYSFVDANQIYTSNATITLSTTDGIDSAPESVEVQFCMRVVQ